MATPSEIVREGLQQFAATGQFPTEYLDPDVEWGTLLETYHGVEGVLRWQREMTETLGEIRVEIHELEAAGDTVVTLAALAGRSQSQGIAGEVRFGSVWRFRDGLLVRLESYDTLEQARAAGAPDQPER
jgi:ketosteroid isomerase-like protein